MKTIKKVVLLGTLLFAGFLLANMVSKILPIQYVTIINDCFSIVLLVILIKSRPKFGHLRVTVGIDMSLATLFPIVSSLVVFSIIHSVINASAAMGVSINGRESG